MHIYSKTRRQIYLVLILCVILLSSWISSTQAEEASTSRLSLVMVGDALLHMPVVNDARTSSGFNFDKQLSAVKPIVKKFDLAYYNQESILGGSALRYSGYPMFNSPQPFGTAMVRTGFNLVSTANNHALDRGERGIKASNAFWKKRRGVLKSGTSSSRKEANAIPIGEKNGITYALLAYTTMTNGIPTPSGKSYLVNRYSKKRVARDIAKAKNLADVVMVSIHYGSEYTHTPTTAQRNIVNYLVKKKVDIVIGHHPHVVQPMQMKGKTLVVWSLGNFISSQRGTNKRVELMAAVDIVKATNKEGDSKIKLEKARFELLYDYYGSGYYKVIPFSKLTSRQLPGKSRIQKQYRGIIRRYDKRVKEGLFPKK